MQTVYKSVKHNKIESGHSMKLTSCLHLVLMLIMI